MNISIALMLAIFTLNRPITNKAGTEYYSLEEALQKGVIQTTFRGNDNSTHYLKPLVGEFKNMQNKKVVIRISAGYRFMSVDTNTQDIVLTAEEMIALNPNEKTEVPLSGMCVQHQNSSPQPSSLFSFIGLAEPKLVAWAEEINQQKWQNVQGQQAMWCLSDNVDETQIIQHGTEQDWQVFEALLKVQGKPIPDRKVVMGEVAKRTMMKAELNGVFKLSFSRSVPVHIALFDENGIVLKEVLNKNLPKGKHEVKYTFDAFPYQGQTIYARLIAFDDVLLNRKIEL